jgi:N-acylglucosamine 2-epimerase
MDLRRIDELITVYRDGLLDDTLPFWLTHGVDREYGGIITSLSRDGSILDTDKGVWQQGRYTWLLGELYNNVDQRAEWLDLALRGADFLINYCSDKADGRMWFHVTREGRPIRKRRYAYSESFAAIAFGELAKATGEVRFAELARHAFQRFIEHNLTPRGVEPKFTDVRPLKSIGFPMITIATAQELRDSIGLPEADDWIDRSVEMIRRDHIKPDMQCVLETVGVNGEFINHFDGRTLNPGHAIEGAWFIMREGQLRGDAELIATGCQMLDWMWRRGWDDQYGGILYFIGVDGLPVQEYWHDMKFWWPHNEAIIATLLAYRLSGHDQYAKWHQQVHDWSYEHFADRQYGEWFGYLRRDGSVSTTLKGNLWKGAFHLPRMQLTCWQILEEMKRGV